MSNYYYVVSSLPLLQFDKAVPINVEYFLDFCGTQLKQADYLLLKQADLYNFSRTFPQTKVYEQFQNWEIALRNELVCLRVAESGQDAISYLRPGLEIISLKVLARRVFEEPSPLQAEVILNKARWDYLDELEAGHFFDIQKLIIYYLKLQLLKRMAYFQIELGKESYTALHQHIFEELKTEVGVYER